MANKILSWRACRVTRSHKWVFPHRHFTRYECQYDVRTGEIAQEYDQDLEPVNTITFVDENRGFVTMHMHSMSAVIVYSSSESKTNLLPAFDNGTDKTPFIPHLMQRNTLLPSHWTTRRAGLLRASETWALLTRTFGLHLDAYSHGKGR